ncbi:hypothetical protein LBMAG15_00840 [Actinomycetes bacterium]|nr:hypothetical protein LBMAG15_00840 [Actinomycetes bacterium]
MAQVVRAGEGVFLYEELHDGIGKISVQRYFQGAHPWKMDLEIWELPVGASEGAHSHDESEPEYGAMSEVYLLIEGSARMTMDGVTVELGPGDAVLAAPGVYHDLTNTGSIPLRVLVITDPATPDDHGAA